jgi:tRNA-2-methylthio-N6-dimethylallyladenosine synthase
VVPYTRGAEVSRSFGAIVDEAKALVDAGAKEITLLGQNVNAWRDGEAGLEKLIVALDAIPALQRIRYTTSHPNDMTEGLVRAHAEVEKLMPFLHLPVQAGSDRILKAMNRSHTSASYLKVIERVRASRPDIAISGDFIVGFPGETDADFEETLQIIRDTDYALAFSFKYSARPGTPAATMEGQIEPHVMDERLQRLQGLLNEQQLAFNQSRVGQRTSILLERKGRLAGQMVGKTPWLQSVHVMTDAPVGAMLEVDLVSAGPNSLAGEIVREMVDAA